MVSPHFFSKSKGKPAKEVYLSKIAAGNITACNFNKKTPPQVPFTDTFFRIFQHTEVNAVNVKHKFHLESSKIKACVHQKFAGKHLCQGLFFNKIADLRPATLLKMRLWQRCFL